VSAAGQAGFPEQGTGVDDLLAQVRAERSGDLDWRGGRAFSLVYNVDDPELERLQHEIAGIFLHENALNPFRYATLLRMEAELLAFARDLFGAGAAALSSGGTESIFLAVLTAREEAASRGVVDPELVCAATAHPAFAKACHYLGVELTRLPVDAGGRAVPELVAAAVSDRTALVVGSAPCYPFGVVDPIPELAAIAAEAGTLCHVDACLGGYLLPFWERLGRDVPPWDFRVEGVTSISADVHKYGYSYKGTSTILYRDRDTQQRQLFMYDDWPGGLYASMSAAGTRPGGPIAGAWATMVHLGAEGYLRLAGRVAQATDGFRAAIEQAGGLRITGEPVCSVFEFGADPADDDPVDVGAVADVMDERGWNLDRQQGGLHVMLSPGHDRVVDAFASDLADAVAEARSGRTGAGVGLAYGGVVEE
jgi:glutamate/tyrosine decarboxylase-like PLP-dependent enzyme